MASERTWRAVAQNFISDGTVNGVVSITSAANFKVKARVTISSGSQPQLEFEIKNIPNKTTLEIGPIGKDIASRSNLSAYLASDNAIITQPKQKRPSIGPGEMDRAVYEEEPVVARRVFIVDKFGDDSQSPTSTVQKEDPVVKYFHGPALEVIRILEYSPTAKVGDIVKETFFEYGTALEVVKSYSAHRLAEAEDIA